MSRVTFLHPDLGIGGAERLVVDAALALQKKGRIVNIVTTHHDKNHAFEETVNGEISVVVVGDWIPRSIFNRFYAIMAYVRMVYAALFLIFFSKLNPDVVICDLVSVAIPVLRMRIENVIFYCHYPDRLLSRREGYLKALYRAPLDRLEEISVARASHVFVNSKFTAGVFKRTFKRLTVNPDILYPSLNVNFFDSCTEGIMPAALAKVITEETVYFLSINRYERKKNLKLALEAFDELKRMIGENAWENVHLIMAGGYDSRVDENVEHFQELTRIRENLNLNGKVTFLKSPNDKEKLFLLKMCTCLIYTPSEEHFGIVPIEAMYVGKPVIAVNNGGPAETVVHEVTGFLCETSSLGFAKAMEKFVTDKNLSKTLGAAGKERVSSAFSFEEFSNKLNRTVSELISKKTR